MMISSTLASRIASRIAESRIVFGIGLLLLMVTGIGMVLMLGGCRRTMRSRSGGCPCMAVLEGDRSLARETRTTGERGGRDGL